MALEQDLTARDAFLSDACAGDEALLREVQSLLSQDTQGLIVDRSVWSAAAPLFDADLLPGTTLGPYRIEKPLGAGGMGEVYLATDTRLNRVVAIKTLPFGLALDPQMRARFAREAQAVASLTHPHICMLYDVGRHGDIDFLVMEHLAGETLADRLAGARMSVDDALACAIEIAGALDHAHRHGIVHRDLKPANIILTASGAKLLDFGLAKFRGPLATDRDGVGIAQGATSLDSDRMAGATTATSGADMQVTHHGVVLGTIRYMAPEQIQGHNADSRSDLFSFGAVLFEMLTGTRAFDGDGAASVRAAILEHEPPAITSLQPLAPPALDALVRRCLAKNPDERWQSANDLLPELKQISDVHAHVRAGGARPTRGTSRGRAWTYVAAALVAALIALGVWVPARRSPPAAADRPIRSVAVLPLENLSAQSGPGVLCGRHDRAAHRHPRQRPSAARDLAHVGHALQDGPEAGRRDCARAAG